MADRLIKADKLRKDILDLPNCYNGYSDTYDKAYIIDVIDEQPTVDAVPVVRCKDCRWYYQLWIDGGIMIEHCHRVRGVVVNADGFCSWGERREDGYV